MLLLTFPLVLLASVALGVNSANVEVVWEEQFKPCNSPWPACLNGLDLSNWNFDYGDGSDWQDDPGWGNAELQCYVDDKESVRVEKKRHDGGLLVLQANRRPGFDCHNPRKGVTRKMDYTSPRINTRGKHSFQWRGDASSSDMLYIEARMKLPHGQGLWPAFWMLPENISVCGPGCGHYGEWCRSGEVDIIEAVSDMTEAVGTLVSHTDPNASDWVGCRRDSEILRDSKGWHRDWHTFGLSWNATHFRWYLDRKKYHEVQSGQWATTGPNITAGNPLAPYDRPFYLILNLAVGGSWPGVPDGKTPFPSKLLVDYVRVTRIACGPTDTKEVNCGDGVDNDCDGLIDREDPDCAACAAQRAALLLVAVASVVALLWGAM